MLADLGAAAPLIDEGLTAPEVQYRSKDGVIAQFDFGDIADETGHPYRLQCEQWRLTRILLDRLQGSADFNIEFGVRVGGVEQDAGGVRVTVEADGRSGSRTGQWLIGADGASSATRHALGIEFEGFTWPERFLVLTTPYDFNAVMGDLVSVNYVADPECWHFLLRIPGVWRVMFPVPAGVDDDTAVSREYGQAQLSRIVAGPRFEVVHTTLYRVHQRVAKCFRLGHSFLAGDAAHINNPLGGMGMNGGIHDAVNLTARLAAVIGGAAPESELDRYDAQRRMVTLESVQSQTIQNKRDLEANMPEDQQAFRDRLRRTAAGDDSRRAYLERISMIASLRRAEQLG